jgi:hypothetical protein
MSIPIDFDKPRQLKFDLAAVRDMEAALGGKPLADIINDITRLGVNALVIALWAGLKHEARDLNPRLVERYLTTYIAEKKSLRKLGQAVNDALDETGLFRNEDEAPAEGNGSPEPVRVTTQTAS